ncbi:hypothetical protein ACE01N_20420 [Saccharicrinis sp. FJH2]|uniref:hypothetical protein n=1 Tax=Saccharicrinis sp. FJH65 TaxID=3344659 RepID=UPI0035F4F013
MNQASRNIESIQKEVKNSVNDLLLENGYSLVTEERFSQDSALLLQWANQERNHAFQLIWDIKEHWFDLGEFNRTGDLKYIDSKAIDIFPFKVIGVFLRNRYTEKYTAKIRSKIEEKLSTTRGA